jgi:hypothetical protein
MCEALVMAVNKTHPDTDKDRRGCYKRGMVVVVMPDGHAWGKEESPSTANPRVFAVLKFPGVSVARVQKYIIPQFENGVLDPPYRRRLWQVQWAELPQAARNKLANVGVLVIGSQAQGGDYTWAQVRDYFMRLDTNARETEALT